MSKTHSLRIVKRHFPLLEKHISPEINIDIFHFLKMFTDDPYILAASLVQNPFGRTEDLGEVRESFDPQVLKHLESLNKLHEMDRLFIRKFPEHKGVAILFLVNFNFTLDDLVKAQRCNRQKILYATKLLEKVDVTEIRQTIEDKLFAILYPEIYCSYFSLLKFTKKRFLERQKEIRQDFDNLLKKNGIEARIEMRLKTISSIHRKIVKKNLLFSQILDTIGLRVIVENEEDCYRSMVLILKNSPIITSRIKDYIAIPKENGYQSIHLTIMHENHPVEIQIRTWEMHYQAQYGTAHHLRYKHGKD